MHYDVITIGAATIDAFVWSKAFRTVKSPAFPTGVGECFSLGSKVEIDRFVLTTGGGATNCGATFANLGMRTACLSAVGDDLFGAGIVDDLKKRGIATALVRKVAGGQTAFSTILVVPSGERTVLVARGVSERLSATATPWRAVRAKWIYMTSLGGDLAFARRLFAHARARDIRVFWNPGSKDIAHGPAHLKPLLARVDVLDMNREEAMRFTGRQFYDLDGMIRDLQRTGARSVILTDGAKGAYLAEGESLWHARSHTKIKVVNRTGAGDAFGSGFLAGLVRHRDRTRALQMGILNSEAVIQKIGAKTGLLAAWPGAKRLQSVRVTAV